MSYTPLKRTIDIILSLFLLTIFSPIIVVTAVAVKLTSPGPVFADTPERVGKDGKLFYPFKFRSMILNAHKLLTTDPKFRKLYQEYKRSSYKLHQDPRVTTVGGFIRRHSIDEVPQLINVLRGEMSLVGPRPYYPDELKDQQKRYPKTRSLVREVLSVNPGVTGIWQVSGRSEVNFDKRIALDARYAHKMSLWVDLKILAKTPWAMVSGKGAV
ncbi:multidrug MFS transporter [Candidatus Woesebacteria bacterium]|nr:multidrug MFS transporter [Candidatus Woesebacteria bacterium]